jgi:NhaC family Na+:H+ antiporter
MDTPDIEKAPGPKAPPRLPTLFEALIPLLAVALFLGVGYTLFDIRIEVLLIASAVVAGLVGWRLGYSYDVMQEGINHAIYKSMTPLLIITVVGAMVASWIACGTIPMMIYYGLQLISPKVFLLTACIICSIVSVLTGTSWGTVGTVGIALLGIGKGLGIPDAWSAGAIVAGAYFGDKLSLFSDTTNLAPIAARSNIYDHVAHMLWTTTPAYLVGLAVYIVLGFSASGDVADSPAVARMLEGITANYNVTGINIPLLMLPAIITIGAAVYNKPVIPFMLISCVLAWILAVWLQPGTEGRNIPYPYLDDFADLEGKGGFLQLRAWLITSTWDFMYPGYAMIKGYELKTEYPELNRLMSQGGMMSMMDTTLLALAAFAFAGIMSATRMLEVLLGEMVKFARTTGTLVATTAASCVLTALMTGSSYLSILLPGELFRKTYYERGLAAKNLSRTTEDCGTVLVPLVPWSAAGVYMAGVLKVPVTDYAPFAVMCYLGVVVAVIYGFTGFAIAPRKRDDETQPGS